MSFSLNLSSLQERELKEVAQFDGAKFRELAAHLARISKPSVRASVLLAEVEEFTGKRELSSLLCRQLLSLSSFRRSRKHSPEEVISALIGGIELSSIGSDEKAWFQENKDALVAMLDCDSVRLPAKALQLSADYAGILVSANVITDLRPVFDGDREAVEGGIVTQTLRLHFLEKGNDDELSLALDTEDIDKLIEELEKAKAKANAAKEFFSKNAKVDLFVVGEETYGTS